MPHTHTRNSLKGNDKASLKTNRPRRHNGGDRRERGFDRGFLPAPGMQPAVVQGSAGSNNTQTDDPADETEDGAADVLSREAIKASSKSKLSQKKRSAHVTSGANQSVSSSHHLDLDYE